MIEVTLQYSTNRILREYTSRYCVPLTRAYHRRLADQGRLAVELDNWRTEPLMGAVNSYLDTARVAAGRPAGDYTPRLVAHHAEARVPLEVPQILWQT